MGERQRLPAQLAGGDIYLSLHSLVVIATGCCEQPCPSLTKAAAAPLLSAATCCSHSGAALFCQQLLQQEPSQVLGEEKRPGRAAPHPYRAVKAITLTQPKRGQKEMGSCSELKQDGERSPPCFNTLLHSWRDKQEARLLLVVEVHQAPASQSTKSFFFLNK